MTLALPRFRTAHSNGADIRSGVPNSRRLSSGIVGSPLLDDRTVGGRLLDKAPAETREEHPDVPTDPAEVARAAREIVRTTIRSRRHYEAIEFFAKRTMKVASLDEIADSLGIPRLGAELVMRDLARSKMVIEDGEMFVWQPSSDASLKLSIFRRALSEPKLRSRLMAWLYAEEKK